MKPSVSQVIKPQLERIPCGIRPLWVIDQRLEFHTKAGGILEGLKYDREGVVEVDGTDDLPYVQNLTISDEEGYGFATGNRDIQNQRKLFLIVSAERQYGLFRRDPDEEITDSCIQGIGVMEWVERVRDAIETRGDVTEVIDPFLEHTVTKPVVSSIREAPTSDKTWSLVIEINLEMGSTDRGTRGNPQIGEEYDDDIDLGI